MQENWSHASKRIFLYHFGFVLKMCNNQAFYFYKRILQCQGSRDGAVVKHSPPTNDMWAEFVGSLLCSERFFSGYSGFPLSSKTNI